MKTATIPSLSVDADLRRAAEELLKEGESLSSFVEQSLCEGIERRRAHAEFITRSLLSRDDADWAVAQRVLDAIKQAIRSLEQSPFSFRKADAGSPFLRELVIPFGASGYVALFEIENEHWVTILAVRHQREDDYL